MKQKHLLLTNYSHFSLSVLFSAACIQEKGTDFGNCPNRGSKDYEILTDTWHFKYWKSDLLCWHCIESVREITSMLTKFILLVNCRSSNSGPTFHQKDKKLLFTEIERKQKCTVEGCQWKSEENYYYHIVKDLGCSVYWKSVTKLWKKEIWDLGILSILDSETKVGK